MRHHLGSEEFDGTHGLLMGEVAPLERAYKVVGTGFSILVQVGAYGGRCTSDHQATDTTRVHTTLRLLLRTLDRGEQVTSHFAGWRGGRTTSHIGTEELREPALFGFEATRCPEVPAVRGPGELRLGYGLLIRLGEEHVHDEANFRLSALAGQRSGT